MDEITIKLILTVKLNEAALRSMGIGPVDDEAELFDLIMESADLILDDYGTVIDKKLEEV